MVNTFFNLAMESFENNNLALCCSQLRRARTLFAEAKTLHGARRMLHIEEDIERLWTKVMLRGQQLHVRNANSPVWLSAEDWSVFRRPMIWILYRWHDMDRPVPGDMVFRRGDMEGMR